MDHIKSRHRVTVEDLERIELELEDIARQKAEAGEASYSEVMGLLDDAWLNDEALGEQVETLLKPQAERWRKDIGAIFEHMGLGIDYEAITKAAEESFERQQQLRLAVMGAQ